MDDLGKFYNKSIRFLSFRPRSEKEIRDYLRKSSFAKASEGQERKDLEEMIDSIINKLKEQKFLNDEEFAKWFIEQRSKITPRAKRLIKIELKNKGIEKEESDRLIEEGSINDLESAKILIEKKINRYKNLPREKAYERLVRFLSSKGFSWDTIKKSIDEFFPKEYN